MIRFILIFLSVFLLAGASAQAGGIYATSGIEGGAAHLTYSGTYQSGGAYTSVTMLSGDPQSSLFTVSGSASGIASLGSLSIGTMAVAHGPSDTAGVLRASASASFQDTMTVHAEGLAGMTGYLVMLWRDPPASGMDTLINGARSAQACTGLCTDPASIRTVEPGIHEIARLPFVFGEDFNYTVLLSGWAEAQWAAGQAGYTYAAVAATLEASELMVWVADWTGHGVSSATWHSHGGLDYALAPARLVENPEPGTVALLGAGLLAIGWLRRHRRRGQN
jgi:hypothetical protein